MTETNAPRTLAGKTALITGGTGGIGLHTASGLAAMGASMIVTFIDNTDALVDLRHARAVIGGS